VAVVVAVDVMVDVGVIVMVLVTVLVTVVVAVALGDSTVSITSGPVSALYAGYDLKLAPCPPTSACISM
jgi:hypothetical protein